MNLRAAKAFVVFFEVLALVIAVVGAGAGYLYWRTGHSAVSLTLFQASAERAIEKRLRAGFKSEIDELSVSRPGGGEFEFLLLGVRITDSSGVEAASAPELSLKFSLADFFAGRLGPKSLSGDGVRISVVRNANQMVAVDAINAAPRRGRKNVFRGGLIGNVFDSALTNVSFAQATISFHDVASGRSWLSENASVEIARDQSGFVGRLRGDIDMGDVDATLSADAQYLDQSGIATLTIYGERFPIGDIAGMFYGDRAAIIEAPASGRAVVSINLNGDILSSAITARLGEGVLNTPAGRRAISFLDWQASFDPARNVFDIESLRYEIDGNRGDVSGTLALAFDGDLREPARLGFDLAGAGVDVNLPGVFERPIHIDAARLAGAFDIADRRLSLSELRISAPDIEAIGKLTARMPVSNSNGENQSAFSVSGNLSVDGPFDVETLLRYWPLGSAGAARQWVAERMDAAIVSNVRAQINLDSSVVDANGATPDDALDVTFDVADAKARYIEGMTAITNAFGAGRLRGNSFNLTIDRANIGDVELRDGEVDFPLFIPKFGPAYYRFTASGRSTAILNVLDEAPLELLSKINLSPGQFDGEATARVEIMRPNKNEVSPEEIIYQGDARFENMQISSLFGDANLSDAAGTVELKPRFMTVTADARLGDAPVEIVWKQNFFEEDGPSQFRASGVLDSATGDLFGMATRRFVRGPVRVSAIANGDLGAIQSLDINADFTDAALSVNAIEWRKAAGAEAAGRLRLAFSPQGVTVRSLEIKGEEIKLSGEMQLDREGRLLSANFPDFFFRDGADLALLAQRDDAGALKVSVVGDYLYAGELVRTALSGQASDGNGAEFTWGEGLGVTGRIDRMTLRENIEFQMAAIDMRRDRDRLVALNFSAFDEQSAPLTVKLMTTGDADGERPSRIIEASANAVGALLKGVFGITSIAGGEGRLSVNLSTQDDAGVSGQLEARGIKIVKAPLLARIFSAGSMDGLSNLLNGQGIDFSEAYGEFRYIDGVLSVRNFRATGPSVGITADGAVGVGENSDVSLTGALAPLYQINSMLGRTPIIGDLFVNKKGEGLLALSYSVSGARDAPQVFVNPLSALTPGIFRQIMNPSASGADQPHAREAPQREAPHEASQSEQSSPEASSPDDHARENAPPPDKPEQ